MRKYFCDGCGKEIQAIQAGREVRYVQQPQQKTATTTTPHVSVHVTIMPPNRDNIGVSEFSLCRSCIANVVLEGDTEIPPAIRMPRSGVRDLFGTKGLQGLGAEIALD